MSKLKLVEALEVYDESTVVNGTVSDEVQVHEGWGDISTEDYYNEVQKGLVALEGLYKLQQVVSNEHRLTPISATLLKISTEHYYQQIGYRDNFVSLEAFDNRHTVESATSIAMEGLGEGIKKAIQYLKDMLIKLFNWIVEKGKAIKNFLMKKKDFQAQPVRNAEQFKDDKTGDLILPDKLAKMFNYISYLNVNIVNNNLKVYIDLVKDAKRVIDIIKDNVYEGKDNELPTVHTDNIKKAAGHFFDKYKDAILMNDLNIKLGQTGLVFESGKSEEKQSKINKQELEKFSKDKTILSSRTDLMNELNNLLDVKDDFIEKSSKNLDKIWGETDISNSEVDAISRLIASINHHYKFFKEQVCEEGSKIISGIDALLSLVQSVSGDSSESGSSMTHVLVLPANRINKDLQLGVIDTEESKTLLMHAVRAFWFKKGDKEGLDKLANIKTNNDAIDYQSENRILVVLDLKVKSLDINSKNKNTIINNVIDDSEGNLRIVKNITDARSSSSYAGFITI